MKRAFFWFVPAVLALAFAAVFATGFSIGVRGNAGEAVSSLPAAAPTAVENRQSIRVVILGDSIARGTGDETGAGLGGNLDRELSTRKIAHDQPVNLAINGAHSDDLATQLDSAGVKSIIAGANAVVVSIGGNDLFALSRVRGTSDGTIDEPMSKIVDRVVSVVERVRSINPANRVYVIGLYNPFAGQPDGATADHYVRKWNAELIDRFSTDPRVIVVQTFDLFAFHERLSFDHFHPGAEGYRLIAQRIADSL